MTGLRLAIFGLGRSGVSIAKAAKARGAEPTVYDEKPIHNANPETIRELQDLNISIRASFEDYWSSAYADLVVTSPGVPKNHPKLTTAVANGLKVISEIEFAYRIAKAPIVGITGTNGKSTTSVMTYLCLLHGGIEAVLCGNIFGSGYPEIPLTEAANESTADQVLVAEISSFQLEWIEEFRPKSATVTNISDDHLNRYASFDDYAQTKRRIFENMGQGDSAVWSIGDPSTEPPRILGLNVLSFGESGSDAWMDGEGLHFGSATMDFETLPFEEEHNFTNAMASVLLARGATEDQIDAGVLMGGLRDFKGLEHRMERLGSKNGVLLINNSMCTNPAAVVSSSLSLPRRQHLLVGGVDKDMNFAVLRDYLATSAHALYLFGSSADSILRQLDGRWPVFTTMREAFDAALCEARPGEAVVLAPGAASMDQFKDFRDRGEAFRAMAKEWLES